MGNSVPAEKPHPAFHVAFLHLVIDDAGVIGTVSVQILSQRRKKG
jgi:hypothetical protein